MAAETSEERRVLLAFGARLYGVRCGSKNLPFGNPAESKRVASRLP
jgi:hypothetical protein